MPTSCLTRFQKRSFHHDATGHKPTLIAWQGSRDSCTRRFVKSRVVSRRQYVIVRPSPDTKGCCAQERLNVARAHTPRVDATFDRSQYEIKIAIDTLVYRPLRHKPAKINKRPINNRVAKRRPGDTLQTPSAETTAFKSETPARKMDCR